MNLARTGAKSQLILFLYRIIFSGLKFQRNQVDSFWNPLAALTARTYYSTYVHVGAVPALLNHVVGHDRYPRLHLCQRPELGHGAADGHARKLEGRHLLLPTDCSDAAPDELGHRPPQVQQQEEGQDGRHGEAEDG